MKKKPILIGIAIGWAFGPFVSVVAAPIRKKAKRVVYNLALDFVNNFDANNS